MSAQEEAVIEAVARAICRAHCGPVMRAKEPERVECQVENGWDMWVDEARAAMSVVIEECAKIVEAQYQTGDHELGHFLNAAAAKIRSFFAYQRATRSREGTWEDIGCHVPFKCQQGKGDPPMDCIHPDCFCGDVFIKPEYINQKATAMGRDEVIEECAKIVEAHTRTGRHELAPLYWNAAAAAISECASAH